MVEKPTTAVSRPQDLTPQTTDFVGNTDRVKIPGIGSKILSITPEPWPKLIDQFIREVGSNYVWHNMQETLGGAKRLFADHRVEWPDEPKKTRVNDPTVGERIGDAHEKSICHSANAIELGKILAVEMDNRGLDVKALLEFLSCLDSQYGRSNELWPGTKALLQLIILAERKKAVARISDAPQPQAIEIIDPNTDDGKVQLARWELVRIREKLRDLAWNTTTSIQSGLTATDVKLSDLELLEESLAKAGGLIVQFQGEPFTSVLVLLNAVVEGTHKADFYRRRMVPGNNLPWALAAEGERPDFMSEDVVYASIQNRAAPLFRMFDDSIDGLLKSLAAVQSQYAAARQRLESVGTDNVTALPSTSNAAKGKARSGQDDPAILDLKSAMRDLGNRIYNALSQPDTTREMVINGFYDTEGRYQSGHHNKLVLLMSRENGDDPATEYPPEQVNKFLDRLYRAAYGRKVTRNPFRKPSRRGPKSKS